MITSQAIDTATIEFLTKRAGELGHSLDRWNSAMLWALIFTALAAVAVVLTTGFVLARSKQLGAVQKAIITAKDKQLSADLKERDMRIAEANERSNEAQQGTAIAEATAAQASSRAAEANEIAEQEHIERLRLEAQIAPRRLSSVQIETIKRECGRFRGRSVTVVSYALDVEGAILAKQVVEALSAPGLQVADATASSSPLGEIEIGIHVTGSVAEMVDGIRQILSSTGKLAVAPADSQPIGGWQIGVASGIKTDVTVLVGVKPIT